MTMIYTPFAEKDAAYYDRIYEVGYDTVSYRPIYDAVLDFLGRLPEASVLEVGCGTGDLAHSICLNNIPYRGFDISPVAIGRCEDNVVGNVSVASAYDAEAYQPVDYNIVIALEVFEHIHDRLAIGKFPPGVQVLFSVPNFVETAHLRAYEDPERDIVQYYRGRLSIGQVLPFDFVSPDGQLLTIYLAHAVVGPGPSFNPLQA